MNPWRALRPELLLPLLAFIAALAFALRGRELPPAVTVEVARAAATAPRAPVTLVTVLPDGASGAVERLRERAEIALPERQPARGAAVLAELRARLVEEGVWPPELPAPELFVAPTAGGGAAWVIDVLGADAVAVSIAAERAIAESLEATARANGADAVAFLVGGRPAATLLGHVGVVNALPERP